MPEELAIAKAALARSFDVLALTPREKVYRCWDTEWPDQSEDIPRVRLLCAKPYSGHCKNSLHTYQIRSLTAGILSF